MPVDHHVSVHRDDPVVEHIRLRHPQGKRPHMRLLRREEFPRRRMQMPPERRVRLLAPGRRLPVQVVEIGECPAGQEIVLDVVERALHASLPIGIALLVRHEDDAETFGERLHLRHDLHLLSGPRQHHDMRIVDHDSAADAAEEPERLGQELLALEASEPRIHLNIHHARMAEDQARGLDLSHTAREPNVMRRRVVLHLFARFEVIAPGRRRRRLHQRMPSAERCQGLI